MTSIVRCCTSLICFAWVASSTDSECISTSSGDARTSCDGEVAEEEPQRIEMLQTSLGHEWNADTRVHGTRHGRTESLSGVQGVPASRHANRSQLIEVEARRIGSLLRELRDGGKKPVKEDTDSISGPSMMLGIAALSLVAVQVLLLVLFAAFVYWEYKLAKSYFSDLKRWQRILIVGFFMLLTFSVGVLAVPYFAGAVVRHIVQNYDTSFIGAHLNIDELTVHPFSGFVGIKNATIENPGKNWTTPFLLQTKKASVRLCTVPFIISFGTDVGLRDLNIKDVRVQFEAATGGGSNIGQVLEFMTSGKGSGAKVRVHDVNVRDISTQAVTTLPLLGYSGLWVKVADIHFNDLSKASTDSLIKTLLTTIFDSAITSAHSELGDWESAGAG